MPGIVIFLSGLKDSYEVRGTLKCSIFSVVQLRQLPLHMLPLLAAGKRKIARQNRDIGYYRIPDADTPPKLRKKFERENFNWSLEDRLLSPRRRDSADVQVVLTGRY
ncbi:hypothetical protein TWF569_003788 [Orbilia oligospora]|uniref:Uncharacterized protein n=1 Tax=Orbilia oligospora TaxID=2813651 RepID=A0A7C8N1G0_ORBOL|nr:hypothetical protein TWF102_011765 [Orbilia oligospora]KAF3104557.1 hypothetical protein TWF103_006881 [Orbilia oligospora]KAF3116412.1 hypothetical protein TWF706_004052 [Orbilia oligospora]KAF3128784.1 hypothetical protein TWF594_011455 [Orbilia oligospora]KAF3151661.1 hypothetical protein TWF569_003788 [Orbilia oligospora]